MCDNEGQRAVKLEALPHTAANKFHQSTPAEAPATHPFCFGRRWPENAQVENAFRRVILLTIKATSQAHGP